jgi:hypothetical protein
MKTLPTDPAPVAVAPARPGLVPPALRRDLADLNGQFLDLSLAVDRAADPCVGWAESVRRRLREIDRPTRARMAAAPFALFRLVLPTLSTAAPPEPAGGVADLPLDVAATTAPGRWTSFTHQATFFARRLVDGAALAANVVLDLTPEAQSMLAALAPSQLAAVAAQPGLVRPRWPDHLRFWEMLEAAARRDSAIALQWAHCVGVCLLGVEAEGTGGMAAGVGRRRPRC